MRLSLRLSFWAIVLVAIFYGMSGLAFAAESYYVSQNGSDSNSGSQASPWRSLKFAVSQLSDGDTLILRGGTYSEIITIKTSNVTVKNYPGETPVIDGYFTKPTGSPPNCFWVGLINLTGANITIDGITIKRSRGRGINCQTATYANIKNCNISYTYDSAVKLGIQGQNGYNTVDNCILSFGNYARDVGEYVTWNNIGAVISIKGGHNTIKNSTVSFGPCAGIEGYEDEYTLIENNVVFGNGLTQIHVAESRYDIIRHNLVYGTQRPGVSDKNGYGVGIELMCELWYDGTNWDIGHEAYGNMIANTKIGIRISYQTGKNSNYASNTTKNFKIYNNTVIAPSSVETANRFNHALSVTNDEHLGSGHVIKNNIFWQSNGEIAYGDASRVDMGYNLWSKAPAYSFRDSTDPTYDTDYPNLNMADYFSKTNGWNNLTSNSLKGNEFSLLSTALYAIGKGTNAPISSPSDKFLQINSVDFTKGQLLWMFVDARTEWEIGASFVNGDDGVSTNTNLLPPILYIAKPVNK
jgi:hypothetical protein